MMEINRSLIINQDKRLYRCPYLLDKKYEIVQDLQNQKYYKNIIDFLSDSCQKCEMLGVCNGGCRYQREENYISDSKCYCDKKMFSEALRIHTLARKRR